MNSSSLDAHVSVFQGSTTTRPCETVPLTTILGRIQDGTYRQAVLRLRQLVHNGNLRAYRLAKEHSVAFTPACAISTRDKACLWEEKLLGCTGLVHFDFDHLENPTALKARLTCSPHVVFAFISPSGEGLKVGIAATGITNPDIYRHAWTWLFTVIHKDLADVHVNGDAHVKFLNALCYVSDDPDVYSNAQAVPCVIPPLQPTPQRSWIPTTLEYVPVEHALAAIANHDADYGTWLTLGMALHSTDAPWARDLWDGWSRQSAKFDEQKQEKSWRSFTRDGKVQIGTLFYLARQQGWTRPPAPARTVPNFVKPPAHLTAWLGPRDTWHGLPLTVERIAP